MIVDLERNDLGRSAAYGTVRVKELMATEAYSHVVHIVSEVVSELADGRDAVDLLAGMFPGGTITGCPKVRCMEIIEEL
jgi:4-amino-4-deoxychorismate synthase (2-amino-4-deoxychorismate-forming) component I